MAEGAYGKMGLARTYALVFGMAYIAVAILELFFPQSDPLEAGGFVIFQRTTLQNVIHFAVGVVVLGSFFSGEAAARAVARVIGVVFLALAIWGFASPGSLGAFLGYEGEIPLIYNLIHAATAALALFAGFASTPARRTATV
ncbi:MAG TPA: DUF4383 domain-containing protein [Actinomycetota bacterium]|nr:DUF4383 domain-containing protein [Actinomycetota bacterium]